jgi:hypothetical protein
MRDYEYMGIIGHDHEAIATWARSHIAVDERWRAFLDAEKRSRIDGHDRARRVLAMLEERAQ